MKKAATKKKAEGSDTVLLYFRVPRSAHDTLKKEAQERGIFLKKLLLDKLLAPNIQNITKV
jgi:hypothetical protein